MIGLSETYYIARPENKRFGIAIYPNLPLKICNGDHSSIVRIHICGHYCKEASKDCCICKGIEKRTFRCGICINVNI